MKTLTAVIGKVLRDNSTYCLDNNKERDLLASELTLAIEEELRIHTQAVGKLLKSPTDAN